MDVGAGGLAAVAVVVVLARVMESIAGTVLGGI